MSDKHVNVSITTGGAAQSHNDLGADMQRRQIVIRPATEACWVKFGGTAADNNGLHVPVNTELRLSADEYPIIHQAVSFFSATTGAKISVLVGSGNTI